MKRFALRLLPFVCALGALCSCGKASSDGKIHILASIFPEYDWVKQVIGDSDRFELSLLMDSGSDMHSFQPSIRDIERVSKADLFLYVGGESDQWVASALANVTNPNQVTMNLLSLLGDKARPEEEKEGMEPGEEEEEDALDEHVWLSLSNASFFVGEITKSIVSLDPENKSVYERNAARYMTRLNGLNERYAATVAKAAHKTLLFADRFPFLYMVKDYGLDYYAAFSGCSAESEASVATVVFLANKLDELKLPAVMKIETSDGKLAQTVRDSSKDKNQKILTLNSLQTTTLRSGKDYFEVMEENLPVLEEALG